MLDEHIDPCDRLVVFPVEDGDAVVLVIARVVAEELGLSLGVVIAAEMVVTERDIIRDALLHIGVALAVDEIGALSGLGHDGTEAAVIDDGLDINAFLPTAYVDELNHLRHSLWQWRGIHRAAHRRGCRPR